MVIEETLGNNGDYILKPELSFTWIKYKESKADVKPPETNAIPKSYDSTKTEFTNDRVLKEEAPIEQEQNELTKDSTLTRKNFTDDPVKEKMFLWYTALFESKEMTLEQFSELIEVSDPMETEDFLFRHAPLKYSYLWRGKKLKFSDETIEKIEKELKE